MALMSLMRMRRCLSKTVDFNSRTVSTRFARCVMAALWTNGGICSGSGARFVIFFPVASDKAALGETAHLVIS